MAAITQTWNDFSGLSSFAHLRCRRHIWMVLIAEDDAVAAASRVRTLFAQNLSRLLHIEKMHGRSAREISEGVGVKPSILSTWRSGTVFPRPDQIDKLSEVLGVKPEAFFRENVVSAGQDLEEALFELARNLGYEVIKPSK